MPGSWVAGEEVKSFTMVPRLSRKANEFKKKTYKLRENGVIRRKWSNQ